MIFKELTERHFKNISTTKILITIIEEYANDFYDEIYIIKNNDELRNVINQITNNSFLFIDIRTITNEYIIEIQKLLKTMTFLKVFLLFSPPNNPLMLHNDSIYNASIKSSGFGGKNKLTIVANYLFCNFNKILSNYNYKEIMIYLPFPSYFPYEREYVFTTTFRDIEYLKSNITIMYFNATNPYDIFYKLNALCQIDYDNILLCDKLIFWGAFSHLLKNKIDYLVISQNAKKPPDLNEHTRIYEISDLL